MAQTANKRVRTKDEMRLLLIICFVVLGHVSFGQTKSSVELYNYVDSLITNVLKYQPDSVVTVDTIVTREPRTGIVCFSTMPKNPQPLIIIDGIAIEKEKLKDIKFKGIQTIDILLKDDKTATALYGTTGSNGIIFLTTKKFAKGLKKNKARIGTAIFSTKDQ